MAKKCVTYTWAKEMVPVAMENVYERLGDAEEFPAIEQTFANVTGNNYIWKPLSENNGLWNAKQCRQR